MFCLGAKPGEKATGKKDDVGSDVKNTARDAEKNHPFFQSHSTQQSHAQEQKNAAALDTLFGVFGSGY